MNQTSKTLRHTILKIKSKSINYYYNVFYSIFIDDNLNFKNIFLYGIII